MKKKLALLTAGALLSAATAVPACAATARRDAGANAQLRQVELVQGAARDMPLGQAINAIVPRDFTVRTAGIARELLDEPVSWTGGRAWTEVLEDLLDSYPELSLDVALGARRVTVRQLSQREKSAALRAATEQAMRREARAESPEAPRRTRAVLTQRGPMAEATEPAPVAHAQPVSNPAQDASLAVMQMAIQTTTQTAIQSAVQTALQYANQSSRVGGAREGQSVASPGLPAPSAPRLAPVTAVLPTPAPAALGRPAPVASSATAAPTGAPTATVTAGAPAAGAAVAAAPSSAGASAAPAAASAGTGTAPVSNGTAASATGTQAPAAARTAATTPNAAAGGSSAASAASATPVAEKKPAPVLPTWEILPADRSVRTALERWTSSAGWQLSWELAVDYPVAARSSITGSFETAVEAVAQSLGRAEVPVKAIMYRGNRVLRIVAKGTE
ncbi:toxin co-regulated pilus biosynthesis Q family protein [Massilia sp. BJB1822]|uniref:toxin co-regulated pilus biosynthesis Q family protein n=1 Tax=Massilia sp. BJB1822 TaxID=2744470 RepID=UPI001592C3EA|nr:toxin co-regulated pilus biosynthesis Q family protein [Massilia sp. BJB1822]NVE00132.1 TcpQ domain-containing protein [Massilia sp. BJB1822]